jgi:hypothetical protein
MVGAGNERKGDPTMTRFNNNPIDTMKHQPGDNVNFDAYLIDDEFDDVLDRQLLAIGDAFADVPNC